MRGGLGAGSGKAAARREVRLAGHLESARLLARADVPSASAVEPETAKDGEARHLVPVGQADAGLHCEDLAAAGVDAPECGGRAEHAHRKPLASLVDREHALAAGAKNVGTRPAEAARVAQRIDIEEKDRSSARELRLRRVEFLERELASSGGEDLQTGPRDAPRVVQAVSSQGPPGRIRRPPLLDAPAMLKREGRLQRERERRRVQARH